MNQDELKQLVAEKAVEYTLTKISSDTVIGIGTGSTANAFIDQLAPHKHLFKGTVASSEASAERLRKHGIDVFELNDVDGLDIYIDGADETNSALQLIKGGGAALTREKIVAAASKEFVCIADASKKVDILGKFPLPVEVIPMARSYVARELIKLGAKPEWREHCITDNGNHILDCHGLQIAEAIKIEREINSIVGVVTNGLFAARPADKLFISSDSGVDELTAS